MTPSSIGCHSQVDDAALLRTDTIDKQTTTMICQQAGGNGVSGDGGNKYLIPSPPSLDRRFQQQQVQQQQKREGRPPSITNKSVLTKVQNYIMESKLARDQEDMHQAQQAQNTRPPLPLPQQAVVQKPRIITPEMLARRPVELKQNIMMRSRHHKSGTDSVSNSVTTDSTEHIQNTKKASAQRKRDTMNQHQSMMGRSENAGDYVNMNCRVGDNHGNKSLHNKQETLTNLVTPLSVNEGGRSKEVDFKRSSLDSVTDNPLLLPDCVAPANFGSVPQAAKEFKRSLSLKSDSTKDSLVTEAEIVHQVSSPSETTNGVIDFKADARIDSKANKNETLN